MVIMPLRFRKMETRRLHSPDIKQIVRVLCNDPHASNDSGNSLNEKVTQDAIQKLPRRLRAPLWSSHGLLCPAHKGLNAHLMDDIWAWIKFEIEVAVGRFLYPIIMTNVLSEADEYRVRQLEPVAEMFLPGWTLAESAPPGKRPIDTGAKWAHQKNGCPACKLTRIGSDEDALFALFAGMQGHLRPRSSGQKGLDKLKSKRLRFVCDWIRVFVNGDQAAQEAYDLGVQLRALRHDAKVTLRHSGQHKHCKQGSLGKPTATIDHRLDGRPKVAVHNPPSHNSIAPVPNLDSAVPKIIEDWTSKYEQDFPRAGGYIQAPAPRPVTLTPTVHEINEDTLAALPKLTRANLRHRDSISPTSSLHTNLHARSSIYSSPSQVTSIASYNYPSAPTKPSSRRHGHDPLETAEERLEKYRKMMARTPFGMKANFDRWSYRGGEAHGRLLVPKLSRGSMYAAFGEEGRRGEEFEVVDLTPPPSPVEESFGKHEDEY